MRKTNVMMLAVVVSLLAAVPADARKKFNVRIGIGDQNASMFSHPDFKRLKVKRVRYFIPWNATSEPWQMQKADEFVNAAKAANVKVFMHISSDDLRRKKAKLPSRRTYKRHVRPLIRHYRAMGVREWGARNEANHDSQATWRSPRRAAWEYKIVERACKRCKVVALDVLDQRGVGRYVKRFYRALNRKWRRRARLVGIHNYSDVNRKRMSGTRKIIRAARKRNRRAKFWLTETGGVVALGSSWKYNKRRAAKRLRYLFRVTKRFRRHIRRVYIYNWTGAPRGFRFDAGLVNPDGSRRPGYRVVRKKIKRYRR